MKMMIFWIYGKWKLKAIRSPWSRMIPRTFWLFQSFKFRATIAFQTPADRKSDFFPESLESTCNRAPVEPPACHSFRVCFWRCHSDLMGLADSRGLQNAPQTHTKLFCDHLAWPNFKTWFTKLIHKLIGQFINWLIPCGSRNAGWT